MKWTFISATAVVAGLALATACVDDSTPKPGSGVSLDSGVSVPQGDSGAVTADATVPGVDAGDAAACSIALDATVTGTLKVTADDNYKLYVNGVLIDDTARVWSAPQTYSVTLLRNPTRKNVIAIEGINTAEIDGLDRGVLADLSFDADGGIAQGIVSDASWKLATTLQAGWSEPGFDDTAWVAATDEGAHGISPWGSVFGTSNAKWIWSYLSSGTAAEKATPETVYVRRTFYFDLAGAVQASAAACP